jgi:hypothetical protein
VFNGNNIGYWPNQFAVQCSNLISKTVEPIFFDPRIDLTDDYVFLAQTAAGEYVVRHRKLVQLRIPPEAGYELRMLPLVNEPEWPSAFSGYPVLLDGRRVWQDYISHAWDGKLLYNVGDVASLPQKEVRARLYAEMTSNPKALMRHAMTILGIDNDGQLTVATFEEGAPGANGVTIEQAGIILQDLGVSDAIVLGAKGDAQLATSYEGPLVTPLISSHDADSARQVVVGDNDGERVVPRDTRERPVPSIGVVYVNP